MIVNHKNKYKVHNIDDGKVYNCTISCVGENEYYVYDDELEVAITSLNTHEIVELMFMHRIERDSEITGRTVEVIEVVN
ncbi:hypothetical protein ABE073_04265 [Lederbergia citrisecunda]|uniref:hypothetical protein n=1 Tax=Lederbergia citrisecunda TaxID=2833583 RepID=UPI003D26E98A